MSKTAKTAVTVVAAGFAAIVVAAVFALIVLGTFDWNRARPWVSKQLSERTGRELTINGNLQVHPFSFTPRVHVEDVSLSNADWGDKKPMLTAERADFSVRLMDLLRGRLVFPEVTLDRAAVLLQRDSDERRNWILHPEKQRSGESPEIHRLTLNDAQLVFKDKITDTDVALQVNTKENEPYGIAIDARGRAR